MPEESTLDLMMTLDLLEDEIMEKPLARSQYFKVVVKALESDSSISCSVIKRVLDLCAVELQDDKKCCFLALKIISLTLKKIKAGYFATVPDVVPSLMAVLNMIKTTALLSKMETMQAMCFETLLLYPDESLIEMAANTPEVTEILNLYCHLLIPLEVRLLPCSLIQKLLTILPPEKKTTFVKENLNIWFTKLIPTIFSGNTIENDALNSRPLDTLEMLTNELVAIDYDDNPHWQHLFECIYNPQKYPSMMKLMLINGWKNWHRLWIVCIRLLKNQITKITSPVGSPINSMLPVVETAFKMDVTNRCRAFQCWEVLIDNFHTETNENYIVKRLKLLIIPLKSNNAKVAETALAKLKTWWHLIQRFQTRLEKFIDTVIISFLHFCFGKEKPGFVPGLLTAKTKKQCVEMFIELAGHSSCPGCGNVPKLNGRIITKKILVDFWNDWVHSLKIAISNFNEDVGLTMKQITCLWKSFVATVAELPDNNIRKDLFNELLGLLETYIKDQKLEITVNLLASLFDDEKIKPLLKPRDKQGPVYKIILLLLDQSFSTFYRIHDIKVLSNTLKPLGSYILDSEIGGISKMLTSLLQLDETTPQNNISYLLTPIAECVYELEYEDVGMLTGLIMWPFKSKNFFIDIEYCSQVWSKLIDYIYPKLENNLKDDIATALWNTSINMNTYLKLHACMVILKHELQNVSVVGYTKMVELLMLITNEMQADSINNAINVLIETDVALLKKVKNEVDQILVDHIMKITENLLNFLTTVFKQANDIEEEKDKLVESLLDNIELALPSKPHPKIVSVLATFSTVLKKFPVLRNRVISIVKTSLSFLKTDDSLHKSVQDAIGSEESNSKTSEKAANKKCDKFVEPDLKIVAKKGKKKETSIVNTVVENGEEFVVVKSNWKFNPRKLTENQKEKFQRKREDIPALYQDLSQSQDEFKLATWKTDSQDTSSNSKSTSASKSADTGNASEVLKKMPSSEVVPKIIENIFSDKKDANVNTEKKISDDVVKVKQTTTRDPKSPRMALKDRVFRNVRNLIEKSSGQKDKDLSESLIQVDNIPKTPSSKASNNNNNLAPNSAPPKLNAERPSRVKRKPKKFDDVEIYSLKRGRRSSSQNDSHSDSQSPIMMNEMETDVQKQTNKGAERNDKELSPNSNQDRNIIQTVAVIESLPSKTVAVLQNERGSISSEIESKPIKTLALPQSDKENVSSIEVPFKTTSADVEADNKLSKKMEVDEEIKVVLLSEIKKSDNQNINNKEEVKADVIQSENEDVIIVPESKDTTEAAQKQITADNSETIKDTSESTNELNENAQKNQNVVATDKPNEIDSANNNAKAEKTPKPAKKQESTEPKSARRSTVKKSRIEKELAIDMVEGHPFLKIQTEKRVTRKNLSNSMKDTLLNTTRRKSLTDKINKSKADSKTTPRALKKVKEQSDTDNVSVTISESQENCSDISDDLPLSEDVIESSQDSSLTTISVKPTKTANKKLTVVLQKDPILSTSPTKTQDLLNVDSSDLATSKNLGLDTSISVKPTKTALKKLTVVVEKVPILSAGPFATQDSLKTDNSDVATNKTLDMDSKDDSILPQNKTAVSDRTDLDLTENMDTEPIDTNDVKAKDDSNDVILINDEDDAVIFISSESQEIANADTQPMNPANLMETSPEKTKVNDINEVTEQSNNMEVNTEDDITATINESVLVSTQTDDNNTASSPYKDEEQRKKDFLDNTLEISPIKTMSPVRDKKSPSPETSSDYVVIKLSSPVQSNGEPFEKCTSPEVFTEDKVSPDKRDLSPSREDNTNSNNSSPSSSLSLKKNRPQVRPSGRAAQMLGLCVPDRLQTIMNTERTETEEPKKSSPSSTPARRNLRILYNSVGETGETVEENEDSENFLKFKRSLPTSDCSPSGPILKRKLVEITDEATISPASKRKRVSFHDPPVSTTVSVQKYIEPSGIRSPQNSALKRQERQNLRSQVILKSPKRLDNVFKLDSVLTKTVESFNESEQNSSDVTQSMSLDETPAVEIIKHSDLNDVDPICPELVDCDDPIENIARELSSATMKRMLLKELEGQIATIGDLAKKTELEVNRLCIKAPKIKVAKRVLSDYASKRVVEVEPIVNTIEPVEEIIQEAITTIDKVDVESQTICAEFNDVESQTAEVSTAVGCVQTDDKILAHIAAQTDESGVKSTKDVVTSCIAERSDFVENLNQHLGESSKKQIAESLPFDTLTDVFMKNVTSSNTNSLITRIISKQSDPDLSSEEQKEKDLALLQNYLSERFVNRDLILFCSQLLAKVHDKS